MVEELTIGELARRCKVTTTTLRYYDELGLVTPTHRVGGQRRCDHEAVASVGVIKFLQQVGLTLAETKDLLTSRAQSPDAWRDLATAKTRHLRRRIAEEQAALQALEHSLACPMDDPAKCPTFWSIVENVLDGAPLADAHDATDANPADP